MRPLEAEFGADLDLAGAGGSVVLACLRSGVHKIGIAESVVRLIELDAIEQIVKLEAQLEGDAFGDRGVFGEHGVPVVDAGAVPGVAAERRRDAPVDGDAAVLRIEGGRIETGEDGRAGDALIGIRRRGMENGRIDDGDAIGDAGVESV